MTIAEAHELAAKFPKYVKVSAGPIGGNWISGTCETASALDKAQWAAGEYGDRGYFSLKLRFISNGTTGAVNESAIKRYQGFIKTCVKLGIPVEYVTRYGNSLPDLAAFEAHIGVNA
jgi:hypothetical protein